MGGKIKNQNSLNFLMVTVVGRLDIFTRKRHRNIFLSIRGSRNCRIAGALFVFQRQELCWTARADRGGNFGFSK